MLASHLDAIGVHRRIGGQVDDDYWATSAVPKLLKCEIKVNVGKAVPKEHRCIALRDESIELAEISPEWSSKNLRGLAVTRHN